MKAGFIAMILSVVFTLIILASVKISQGDAAPPETTNVVKCDTVLIHSILLHDENPVIHLLQADGIDEVEIELKFWKDDGVRPFDKLYYRVRPDSDSIRFEYPLYRPGK